MRRMRHLKPREIQGCQLALDASISTSLYDATSGGSLVAADGAVARWEDQSGNGYHVTQATGAAQPARRVAAMNGTDSLQFDGGDYLAQSASSQSKYVHVSAGSTLAYVAHFGTGSNPNAFYGVAGNNTGAASRIGFYAAYEDTAAVANDAFEFLSTTGAAPGSNFVRSANKITPNAPVSVCMALDNANATAGNRLAAAVNGAADFGGNTYTQTPSTGNPFVAMQVGAIGSNALPLTGYIAKLSGWDRVLGAAVRKRLQNADMRKWRING